MNVALEARQRRYDAGMTDAQLAKAEGSSTPTIRQWRRGRGLKPNSPGKGGNLSKEAHIQRNLFYRLGWSDRHIAREMGVEKSSVRGWRVQHSLPANFRQGVHEAQNPRPSMSDVVRRVRRAIGRALPRDIADDAVSDLLVAILAGEIELTDIERDARKFGNRVLGDFASKFGARSIDEIVPGTDDMRLIDTLQDEPSSSWLEEMGATVW